MKVPKKSCRAVCETWPATVHHMMAEQIQAKGNTQWCQAICCRVDRIHSQQIPLWHDVDQYRSGFGEEIMQKNQRTGSTPWQSPISTTLAKSSGSYMNGAIWMGNRFHIQEMMDRTVFRPDDEEAGNER